MRAQDAIALLETVEIHHRPGWVLRFEDLSDRYEDSVRVCINYSTMDSTDYSVTRETWCNLPLFVHDVNDVHTLYRKLFEDVIMRLAEHEEREFFHVQGEQVFNPHTMSGMETWGNPWRDMSFGII